MADVRGNDGAPGSHDLGIHCIQNGSKGYLRGKELIAEFRAVDCQFNLISCNFKYRPSLANIVNINFDGFSGCVIV